MTAHASLSYRLREARFDELIADRGWLNDHQAAQGLGISHTTIGRIRRGQLRPGLHFIGVATATLGVDIDDLFERVDNTARAAA